MFARPPRRAPLCLFCAASLSSPPLPQRLLPYVQAARRSGGSSPSRKGRRVDRIGQAQFNPLRAGADKDLFKHLRTKLEALRSQFAEPDFLESLRLTQEEFDQQWLAFERSVNLWIKRASSELSGLSAQTSSGRQALEDRLRYLFYAQIFGGRYTKTELQNQKQVADLRYPTEWYPATREIPRTVHLHVGPTNSGKTYHALKRLEEADRGIYLGPLRLLAHEVYTRLSAKGKSCALVTGEEQRMPEGETNMWSCTVEMAPLNTQLDVAVIDEIQMINHRDRGWAWTQAFLGIKAREIHLCGEARTVPLIRELCALVGDKVHVHDYKRLTPLQVQKKSLRGKLTHLEKGDCVVGFSVLGIHALRREIEKKTGRKCAIVYGSLPPETRAQQARLFNDPDNDYDFLVASDAIGMGLNLAIKRVIFESTVKNNGTAFAPLEISEVKQIAGRAGRYKTAHQTTNEDMSQKSIADTTIDPSTGLDQAKPEPRMPAVKESPVVGYVTTLDQMDYDHLQKCMTVEPKPIKTAGLFPPSITVERFANYFPPGTPFSYILLRLHEISHIHPRFHLCALRDQLSIADAIHQVKNLSVADRITICAAPTNMRDESEKHFLRAMAECIADDKAGDILQMPSLPLEVLDLPPSSDRKYLVQLEQLHKMLVAYLWLSYRFPHVFITRSLAFYTKKLVEDAIEKVLTQFSYTEQARATIRKRRKEVIKSMKEQGDDTAALEQSAEAAERAGMPKPATDILNDTSSFESEAPITDDAEEYPQELELLDPPGSERRSRPAQRRQAFVS